MLSDDQMEANHHERLFKMAKEEELEHGQPSKLVSAANFYKKIKEERQPKPIEVAPIMDLET